MKKSRFIIASILAVALLFAFTNRNPPKTTHNMKSIYSESINSLTGTPIDLTAFKGKKILIVNTASECGFTGQYEGLQQLHETYGEELVVIGVPCNQFGSQEPGTANDIESFCEINYGVTFLMTEKIEVKGKEKHPLYEWLTNKELNGVKNTSVKWNFQKYLIDEEGNYMDVFYSITKPMSSKITKHLK